jgi:anti-sigma regulatory factor (Ser/Thr protein kinase)
MPERSFAAAAESVAAARAFVSELLVDGESAVRDRVLLLVSELASNSVRHAHAPFAVRLDHERNGIRVAVHDEGNGRPRVRHPAPSEPSGRGLQIVAALSDGWGVEPGGPAGGTTVWFEIRTPGATGPQRAVRTRRTADPTR